MNYRDALAWLYATQERGIKLGLDRTRHFLEALGWRQEGQRFIHVAGTNGKGSVCAMVESVCRAAGYRTALFTSPHLVTFRERIQLGGEMAGADRIAAELSRIREICEADAFEPTFFEISTALAFMIFQRENPDIAVIETGLGGRLDSTNVVLPRAAVITSIGLDHTEMLGPTLRDIAGEKAGILKPGVPAIAGPMPPEAAEVIASKAKELGAPLFFVTEPLREIEVGLPGLHQRINAAIALRAIESAGFAIPPESAVRGLRQVQWPGRFQRCCERFILDGAHNPDAAKALARTWRETFGERRTPVILGVLRDKDAAGICAELAEIAESFIIVPVRSPRASGTAELRDIAARWRPSRVSPTLAAALDEFRAPAPAPALIAGSLFLVGEALALLGLAEGEPELSAQ